MDCIKVSSLNRCLPLSSNEHPMLRVIDGGFVIEGHCNRSGVHANEAREEELE